MRIKTGQKIYKVRSVDGRWIKKGVYPNAEWTESEEAAHVFKKLHHLRSELQTGVLSPDKLTELLDGLPPEALQVVEYELKIHQTGRKHRLTEITRFYEPGEKGKDGSSNV